jgi:hypothetical protein
MYDRVVSVSVESTAAVPGFNSTPYVWEVSSKIVVAVISPSLALSIVQNGSGFDWSSISASASGGVRLKLGLAIPYSA